MRTTRKPWNGSQVPDGSERNYHRAALLKGPTNTGVHVGKLWSNSGTLLASVTFTGETASGWQQMNFATPVTITANTTYVASYYAPNGRYSGNGELLHLGVDNAPLRALATGEDGGNGVYRYGAGGGFPTNTYNAANYWVDVVFVPSNTAAMLVITAPTQGQTISGTTVNATYTTFRRSGSIRSGPRSFHS